MRGLLEAESNEADLLLKLDELLNLAFRGHDFVQAQEGWIFTFTLQGVTIVSKAKIGPFLPSMPSQLTLFILRFIILA